MGQKNFVCVWFPENYVMEHKISRQKKSDEGRLYMHEGTNVTLSVIYSSDQSWNSVQDSWCVRLNWKTLGPVAVVNYWHAKVYP